MAEQQNLLLNPLLRYGMPATTAIIIVAIAFLFVEDQIVRATMLLVAGVDVVTTPWVVNYPTYSLGAYAPRSLRVGL